jgi:Fe-S oxidoreductase
MEEISMHPLIDRETVNLIRSTGKTLENLPDRETVFRRHALPYDQKAENIVITGCQIPSLLPDALVALTRFFRKRHFSFTFLSEEYCCGNYLYRPAIKQKNDAAINECRELSREFVSLNIKTARKLGADRLIIFCSPCYPIYKYAFPHEKIVFYPAAIKEIMEPLHFDGSVDYYAGCYRLHRRFAPVPMDLASTNEVLAKVEGLQVNRITAPKCCFSSEGLDHMIRQVKNANMVHICSGCYMQAVQHLPKDKQTKVLMLPEFVDMISN